MELMEKICACACCAAITLLILVVVCDVTRPRCRKCEKCKDEKKMDELAPCAFCGGNVELLPSLRFKDCYVIFCPACCIQTDAWDDADALREAWNSVGGWKKE